MGKGPRPVQSIEVSIAKTLGVYKLVHPWQFVISVSTAAYSHVFMYYRGKARTGILLGKCQVVTLIAGPELALIHHIGR